MLAINESARLFLWRKRVMALCFSHQLTADTTTSSVAPIGKEEKTVAMETTRTTDTLRMALEMQWKLAADRVAQMRAEAERARKKCIDALEAGRHHPNAMATFVQLTAEADTYERAAKEILGALQVASAA
jgi:hypothetical protein